VSAIVEGLNEAQKSAVTAPDGPVLVLAGPGSGKTRVLTRRIAWLVEEHDIPPYHIMAVTFTNKAAREMRTRVEAVLGTDLGGSMIGTFHSICARILRRESANLSIGSDYVIFDSADQLALMKEVVTEELQLDDKRYNPRRILHAISAAKNEVITPEKYQPTDYFGEIVKRAYKTYQERLILYNAVDFDDLLMYVVHLFADNPTVIARYQRQYEHVLVDEFQDTNGAQYALVKHLSGGYGNLFCVGDEDQSIYRWRGADYRNVQRLKQDFPTITTILLEQNYRSTQHILDAATAVIERNPHRTPKKLFTDQDGGPLITLFEAHNEQYEAEYVVEQIAALAAVDGIEPGECAIMYRTNAQSRVFEEVFVRHNLPYRLVGATRFYSRREIKDILAYLRVIHNPQDTISLNRIINTPSRGIGDKTIQQLVAWANNAGMSMYGALTSLYADPDSAPLKGRATGVLNHFTQMLEGWREVVDDLRLPDLLRMVLDEINYRDYVLDGTEQGEERWENVEELLNVAAEFEGLPLSTFLEEVSLVSDVDNLTDNVNAPTLLTLHAAKGLEYDAVFLVGLEESILPHSRSKDDPEEMAEERRLMYVGMTRARKRLFLVYTFRRTLWGESAVNMPSRFIEDIPSALMSSANAQTAAGMGYRRETTWDSNLGYSNTSSGRPPRARIERPAEQRYRAGQRVQHARFGEGIVVASKMYGNDEEVSVAFEESGLKRLMASFANLELLEG